MCSNTEAIVFKGVFSFFQVSVHWIMFPMHLFVCDCVCVFWGGLGKWWPHLTDLSCFYTVIFSDLGKIDFPLLWIEGILHFRQKATPLSCRPPTHTEAVVDTVQAVTENEPDKTC